jgi:RHS repeat-associated protein
MGHPKAFLRIKARPPAQGYYEAYNVDGEGRPYQVSPYSGPVPVTNTTYNSGSLVTRITYGSGDTDSFTYDSNTNRMTQYQFTVNSSSLTGVLGWNPNGTLHTQNITDAFNAANTQNCSYGYDDLTRLTSANCGSAASQTFSYNADGSGAFGNISKSGSPYSFQPTYSASTNRMTSIGSFTPTYDGVGDVTNDSLHTYTWDAYGRPATIDSVTLTYDAFGKMVEQNRGGAYTQFVYSPTGQKMQIMNGQTSTKSLVALPGGGQAVFTASGQYYYHPDHLGSFRFGSTSTRTMYFDTAYAPFGETYASSGSTDPAFTSQRQDTVSGLYDFPAREYSIQGRWPSPDPAGPAAVDPSNPQSWNRYAYALNNPTLYVDPLGLDPTAIFCFPTEVGGWTCVWPSDGGGGSGNPPCTVQAVPDPYTELVLAGYGLPEDLMEMAAPQQSRGCGRGGGSNTGGPQPPCLAGAGPLAPGQSRCPAINDPCANATLAAAGVDIQQNIVQAQSTISLGRMMGVTGGSYNHTVGLWAALFNYATLVGTGGPQDVKNHPGPGTSQQRVDAGNISFGVTCSFGGAFCQFAAGLAQTVSGNPNFQGTLKTGFDTPSDNAAIRVGQAMRAAGCHE